VGQGLVQPHGAEARFDHGAGARQLGGDEALQQGVVADAAHRHGVEARDAGFA
jgi:hypothetical protein